MRHNLLVKKDEQTISAPRPSYYAYEDAEDAALSAEILGVAKLREAIKERAQTVFPTASSSTGDVIGCTLIQASMLGHVGPVLLAGGGDLSQAWGKWNAREWVNVDVPLLYPRLSTTSHSISEVTSIQRESSVAELITNIRASSDSPFASKLASRLDSLVDISEEEFPEQKPVASRSLKDFIIFIDSLPGVRYPSVVLTYEGNIRAEWTISRNKHFAVEFMGHDDVRFVVFAPDAMAPHKTNRVSGVSTLSSVCEQATPYGVFEWVINSNNKAA